MALAPYAVDEKISRGRRAEEPAATYRGEFARDRDRIIHSTAFRRLMYKTQVFVNHEGDHYRTRLTHSLEVAQIARTIASALNLNESLVEAICLAHDLGHTPFGHAGQDALNACMKAYGGFEHNLQSLRVVDQLEARYPKFDGLNLMFDTREGILKHCSKANARMLGAVGQRFLERTRPSLEAQLADITDAIAYNHHDVDDGCRAGLLSVEQLCEQAVFAEHHAAARREYPELQGRRLRYEIIRRMIGAAVADVIDASRERIKKANPQNAEDVRKHSEALIGFSSSRQEKHLSLKQFLRKNLYQHSQVRAMNDKTQLIVTRLFECYRDNLRLLPEWFLKRIQQSGDSEERVVADYIAGMTDRFALAEYARLCE